jgi:hypothetical protein
MEEGGGTEGFPVDGSGDGRPTYSEPCTQTTDPLSRVLGVVHKEEPPACAFRVNWEGFLGRNQVELIIAITQVLVKDIDKQGTDAIQAPEGYGDFLRLVCNPMKRLPNTSWTW